MHDYSRNNRIPVCTMLPRRNPVVDRSSLFFVNLPGRADLWKTARRCRYRISRLSICRWLGYMEKNKKKNNNLQFVFRAVSRIKMQRNRIDTMESTLVLLRPAGFHDRS